MSYTNSADNLEYYYDGANVDDGSDIDMEDDLLPLLDDAKKHSEEDTNNNNVGRDRKRMRSWKKYLVSWCKKCGEEEDANKRKRKRMGNYNKVQVLGSGGGGCCWGTVVVLGRALRNSKAAVEMNYYKYNDGSGTSGSPPPPPPYESLHRHHMNMMKLDVDGNGGLSSSSYYGPIYLVT